MRFDLAISAAAVSLFVASCREPAAPPTGQALYTQHCASCHGESGDGAGAVLGWSRRLAESPPLPSGGQATDVRTAAAVLQESFSELARARSGAWEGAG